MSDGQKLNLVIEFGSGAETLFGNVKTHKIVLDGSKTWKVKHLIDWIADNLLTGRLDYFVRDGTVRPGILVLINDTDWQLHDELEYELQDRDNVTFISTLHGG